MIKHGLLTIALMLSGLACFAQEENYESLAANGRAFAFQIFDAVAAANDSNICFSPLSVQMALSMVQNGAAGNTLQEMKDVMGMGDYTCEDVNLYNQQLTQRLTYRPEFKYNPDAWASEEEQKENYEKCYPVCELANGVWSRKGTVFRQDFYETLKTYYDAEVADVDFTTQEGIDQVNHWVSDKTHQLIPSIFDTPQPYELAMVLANVLYFKGAWALPFAEEYTFPGNFHLADGTMVKTEMMNAEEGYRTSSSEKFRTVTLGYGHDGKFSMTLFVPVEGYELPSLGYDDWAFAKSESKYKPLALQMPKFYVEGKYDLKEVLRDMGMQDAFNPDYADFSRMRDEVPMWIEKIYQMSKIIVNEKGTEATAVTVVEMYDNAVAPDEYEEFRVDRPFYFTIESQDAILFVGRVNELQSTAGISTAKVFPKRDGIYDLQGRRLTQRPDRGLFVENGKLRVAK